MKKVKLRLDDLHVESFEIDGSQRVGTVRGQEEMEASGVHSQCWTHCAVETCEGIQSAQQTHCNTDCPSWDGSSCGDLSCYMGGLGCGTIEMV
jgi:hypothetical protein